MAAVASIVALALGVPAEATPVPSPPGPAPKPQVRQVTLLTGDRVTLRDGDRGPAMIDAGAGREQISFDTYRAANRLYVVPSDVRDDVARGRLDRRLFDVTGLIAAGYDDRASTSIPVIVTYAATARKRSAIPGAKVTRQLPIVNGAAMSVGKSANFLSGTSGVDKVWLDGKRQPTLDVSVPRIGTPAAWQAGYTGKGVKVAVLDSGIDATHPDLTTRVVAAKNFTAEADGDRIGHGTHVASTIAGTGAASGGKYKGVAPDAELYDGKVCTELDCPESAILAGMEWAATEVRAKVVNLSLGGDDTPELDPLEAAVNRLTAETGTLFVIAAGNSGPEDRTVSSPGSADAALTVGSVGRANDALSLFSGRGPRVGDGAVKPDLTAPGQSIVAAKAKDSNIGTPVGEHYLTLSGTSMATPHTAGAAALLGQQHPEWKAGELKGALMGSAKPASDQTAFQQGAGRVDVAKAIEQTVVSDPGNLSFGKALWPHDDDVPVTKELTYRNLGNQPVTLALTADLKAPDGSPAPADALTLSATTLTVPAGGQASVRATSNTKHNGPDGFYSGRVTATSAGVSVTTAVGVEREDEHYTLTLKGIGPDGKPAPPSGVVYGVADDQLTFYGTGQPEVQLRLRKGEYMVDNRLAVAGSKYWTSHPNLQVTADTTLVLDARKAKQVEITIPRADASLAVAAIGYTRTLDPGSAFDSYAVLPELNSFYTLQLGPGVADDSLRSLVTTQWAKRNSAGQFDNSPYLYAQAAQIAGRFPTGYVRKLRAQDFAVLRQQLNAVGKQQTWRAVVALVPGTLALWTTALRYDQPSKSTVMVEAKDASWYTNVVEPTDPSGDPGGHPDDYTTWLNGPIRKYEAGRTYHERYNAAVFGTASNHSFRNDDWLAVYAHGFVDADGNHGETVLESQSSKLFRNNELVGENDRWGFVGAVDLPAEKSEYRFETTQTRTSAAGLSTRTDLRWTFTSAETTTETRIPLLGIGYRAPVGADNIADRTPTTALPVILAGDKDPDTGVPLPLPTIKSIEVEVSGDDGASWKPTTVSAAGPGAYRAVFATPAGARAVSLKTKVVDTEGRVTEQTTIKAYPLR
nr:S8 family serine peptidase [Kribbella sandramycini]